MFDLKSTEELSFMTLKSNVKFEEKLTCGLENDMEVYGKFSLEHLEVSKMFPLMGSFSAKYILLELKKHRGVVFHYTEE